MAGSLLVERSQLTVKKFVPYAHTSKWVKVTRFFGVTPTPGSVAVKRYEYSRVLSLTKKNGGASGGAFKALTGRSAAPA